MRVARLLSASDITSASQFDLFNDVVSHGNG